jgi:hypothetical protein
MTPFRYLVELIPATFMVKSTTTILKLASILKEMTILLQYVRLSITGDNSI